MSQQPQWVQIDFHRLRTANCDMPGIAINYIVFADSEADNLNENHIDFMLIRYAFQS